MRFRSFKRGTVSLCRSMGCKVVVCQTLKMIWLSRKRTRAALVWFEFGRVAGFFSDLQLWQLVALQPFDLQRPTVPVQKDINLIANISSAQETSSILKKGFVLSKWPYFHQANSVTFCNQIFVALLLYRIIHRFALHISTQSSTQIWDTYVCYTEFYTDLQYVFLHTSTQSPSMYILLFKVNSMYFNTEFGGTKSIFFRFRFQVNIKSCSILEEFEFLSCKSKFCWIIIKSKHPCPRRFGTILNTFCLTQAPK